MHDDLIRRPAVHLVTVLRRRLARIWQRRRSVTRLIGPFDGWSAAAAASDGYDNAQIVHKTADATRRLLRGEAAYAKRFSGEQIRLLARALHS